MGSIPTSVVYGTGQSPGSNALSIGLVTFNSSECPSELPIGVEQMATSQTLVGGSRVVQTFGVSADEITWTGHFFGTYISTRIEQLRHYCANGLPVTLSWLKSTYAATASSIQGNGNSPISQVKEQYTVIIRKFTPKFYAQYAEYTITLIVVKSLNGVYNATSPASIDTQINALQAKATSLTNTLLQNDSTQATNIAKQMNAVNAALNQANPISHNPNAASGIQQAIQSAQQAVTTYLPLLPIGSSNLSTAIQLNGVLSAISRNVANGSAPQSVTQQGGNLFTIAAQQYGDPSFAYALANIAGASSPFLPSAVFTHIPLPNLIAKGTSS